MNRPLWRPWHDWSLGAKSAGAVAMPLGLLLLSLAFSYRLQREITAADADVRRALAIKADIQTLHSLVAESATAVRGYLLTGRDEFLAPYRQARQELPATRASLHRNIRDPEMRQRLERMEHLLDRKLLSLDELRDRGRSQSPPELQAHLLGSKGILDALREEIRAMNAREADLVGQYSEAARKALQRNLWVDAVTSLLVLLTGLAAFALLFGSVVRRVKRLTVNAERLTRDEPLQALPTGRDELGQLASRLQNASLLLAERAAEARSASAAKSQFLSRTSHELRTPLNAIVGFAQLLEFDLGGSRQLAAVTQILTAGRHLLSLIDEVLDIARIESGELRLQPQPLALAPLLAELRELTAPLASQHGVTLELGTELMALAVQADRQRLRQILLNLLSNAVKYNRPGGKVQLDGQQRGTEVWLSVRDTGMGIAPERMSRLFTPFDRLDAETGPVPGTGLGLALSRQMALQMGGDIEAASVPGAGSCFTLRLPGAVLPASGLPPAVPETEYRIPPGEPVGRWRVLAVEDNASNLALLQALLARRPEWQLLTAREGSEGLRLAREHRPELILLDLHLPGRGGETLLAELRAEPSLQATRFVIISADAQTSTILRLRSQGADDYLTKPLAVPRLLALLDHSRK